MNKYLSKSLPAFCLGALVLVLAVPASAAGVPTADAINAMLLQSNAMAQAKEALDALNTAKDAIRQAEQQYNNYKGIVTGNDKLGGFLNNPALNKVLPLGEWSQVYTSVQDIGRLRQRYGLKSDNVSVQARFDQMLAATDALERMYDASSERVKNAELLRAKLDEVQTPQQKADLQLRFEVEKIEQQNQQMRLANMQMLQEQQAKIANEKRGQDFKDYMSGKTKSLPRYD